MINIEVEKGQNENNASLLRRFTKRVRGSGVLTRVRSLRYHARSISPFTRKKQSLKKLNRREEREELLKLGKIREEVRPRRR
ncbi:MAG: hypothetical protein WDZ88_00840 [Candidatus Paceibacterota bacterium]